MVFPFNVWVLVPLFGMIFVATIIIVPLVLRSQERQRMHNTVRRLHEEGQTITPDMLKVLQPDDSWERPPRSPTSDLRRGLILIAVALGLVVLGSVINMGYGGWHPIWPIIGAAAFPGLIGLAFVIMWQLKLSNPNV